MKKPDNTNSENTKTKGKIQYSRTLNIRESLTKRENSNSYIKKLEEMKDLYKRIIVKSITHNFNKKAYEDMNRNLNRLLLASSNKSMSLELIFIDFYYCCLVFLGNDIKSLSSNLNKLVSKIQSIDMNFEYTFNQNDKLLFHKIVYDNVSLTLGEILGEPKGQFLDSFETFFKMLLTKEHLQLFSYFLGIVLSFKGNNETKENYVKLFMENCKITEHTLCSIDVESKYMSLNNSVSNDNQIDRFTIKLKEIVLRIQNPKMKSKSIKTEIKLNNENLKPNPICNLINESPSPRKTFEKRCYTSSKNKVSNYQKYIKNLKNIKERIVILPNNNNHKSPPVKENLLSLEFKLNRKQSSNEIIIPSKFFMLERDDSVSLNLKHHSSSTKDFSNMSKNKINTEKNKKTYHLPIFGIEETIKPFSIEGDNLTSLIDKIDSRLNEFENHITVFEEQMKLCKEYWK